MFKFTDQEQQAIKRVTDKMTETLSGVETDPEYAAEKESDINFIETVDRQALEMSILGIVQQVVDSSTSVKEIHQKIDNLSTDVEANAALVALANSEINGDDSVNGLSGDVESLWDELLDLRKDASRKAMVTFIVSMLALSTAVFSLLT